MRRLQWSLFGALLSTCAVALALSGCKKADVDDGPLDEPATSKGGGAAVVKMTGIKMGNGTIKGKVVWKGAKPDTARLTGDLVAQIEKKDDRKTCLDCKVDEREQQRYRIGQNDNVGNVVVWLTPPDKNSFFEFTPDDLAKLKLEEVKIDQPHCAFTPHIARSFTHYADPKNPKKLLPTGQLVNVYNNSPISHNTKWEGTSKIRGDNQLLPQKSKLTLPLVPETKPLRIACSIHEWMDAFIWPLNHPYADITRYNEEKPDDPAYGTYEIKNVPTGVKLKIVAWQEEGGFLTPDKQLTGGFEVELKDGETLTKDFEISGK